ncbi:hypothetical protein ACFLZC_00010 [Patescibacteria group bacterium]
MSKNIANPTPSQVSGRLAKLHRLLEEDGLPWEAFQQPIDDPQMRARLVNFWRSDGCDPTTDEKMARATGIPMFGVQEAIQHFGIMPTVAQLAILSVIPFSEQELQETKDTHILVAVFPLSVLDVRKVDNSLFYSSTGGWYESKKFAKNKGKISWQLVRKTPVEDSTSKNWSEQQTLLGKNDKTPKFLGHGLYDHRLLQEHGRTTL